jgi:transposase
VAESADGVVSTATSGYDGSKRHLLTDTLGLLLTLAVTAANVPDRNAGAVLAARPRRRGRTRLALIWGDLAYNGDAWTAGPKATSASPPTRR